MFFFHFPKRDFVLWLKACNVINSPRNGNLIQCFAVFYFSLWFVLTTGTVTMCAVSILQIGGSFMSRFCHIVHTQRCCVKKFSRQVKKAFSKHSVVATAPRQAGRAFLSSWNFSTTLSIAKRKWETCIRCKHNVLNDLMIWYINKMFLGWCFFFHLFITFLKIIIFFIKYVHCM